MLLISCMSSNSSKHSSNVIHSSMPSTYLPVLRGKCARAPNAASERNARTNNSRCAMGTKAVPSGLFKGLFKGLFRGLPCTPATLSNSVVRMLTYSSSNHVVGVEVLLVRVYWAHVRKAVEADSRRGSGLMPAGPRAGPVLASTSMS